MNDRAKELIAQLEAEIAQRDARIAELVGVRDHLRMQASIQAQEARTQRAIVMEIGKLVGCDCDWLVADAVRDALKAQQPSVGVVLPEPDFYWISGDEGCWNSPEEWAQDYYDNNGEKPESVLLSCAAELPDREYDSFEFDENGSCTSLRPVVRDEVSCLNPCRAQAVPDGWVMVPVEPTGEMEQFICNCDVRNGAITGDYPEWQQCYKAMLAAAPSAQQKESGDE